MAEPAVNYYSSANSYKNVKHHSHPCPTYPKHSSALRTETPHRYQQLNAKSSRNKDYANDAAVAKKDRYKNQQEGENDTEYIDDVSENYAEDNLVEDADDEAANDQEGVVESLDKEYDEQDVDDQVDDESDVPAEPQTTQRDAAKKEALLLRAQQRLRTINQQQDPHRIHYRQHSPRLHQAHTLATRFQDSSSFPAKGRFGDDAEILDPFWCGHCKPRHYVEESTMSSEIPSPALYSMKSRRSRNTGTPMHETLEGKYAADEISHGYTRIPLRYTKDASNVSRDRIRQQSVQGPTRTSVRYDP